MAKPERSGFAHACREARLLELRTGSKWYVYRVGDNTWIATMDPDPSRELYHSDGRPLQEPETKP